MRYKSVRMQENRKSHLPKEMYRAYGCRPNLSMVKPTRLSFSSSRKNFVFHAKTSSSHTAFQANANCLKSSSRNPPRQRSRNAFCPFDTTKSSDPEFQRCISERMYILLFKLFLELYCRILSCKFSDNNTSYI